MAEKSGQDKTEKATPHRRQKAQEEGNVFRSMDVNSVAILFAGFLMLRFASQGLYRFIDQFMTSIYSRSSTILITAASFPMQINSTLLALLPVLLPLLLVIMVIGVGINVAQSGLVFAFKALEPKFERLNPVEGVKKLFTSRSLVEFVKGVFKMLIVGVVAYAVIKRHIEDFWLLADFPTGEAMRFITLMMSELVLKIGLALMVLAAGDFFYQKWYYEKQLKMSKQEVKDEQKQYENPETKSRIRSVQRQLARRRMMAAVPKATVVITNPTYIAIALRYEPKSKVDAPKVIAKGKRKIAEKIREIAAAAGVPIVENRMLARSMFENLEVGMEIPAAYYQAVAEILAQVYKLKGNPKYSNSGYAYAG